jgi:hypothetical protein
MAMAALLPSVVYAQEARVHPPGSTQAYRYRDSDGTGVLTITDIGPVPGSNFNRLQVQLAQNNITYHGSGYSLALAASSPTEALWFALIDARRNAYVFNGSIMSGSGGVTGGGTYHSLGFPLWTNAWRVEGVVTATPTGSSSP